MEGIHMIHIDIPVLRISSKVSNIQIQESELQRRVKNVLRKSRGFSQISLQHYRPKIGYPLQLGVLKKEENQLPYMRYIKEQDKNTSKHYLNVSLQQKYKIALNQLRYRLYTEDPPDDVKALTDIDKDFFNYVNGRPVSDRVSLYKSLKAIINNIMITKLEIGFRRECMLNIEKSRENEMKIYEKSLNMFTKQTKYLENFISEDYKKSLALLDKCDDLHHEVNLKRAELKLLADHQCAIVSSLLRLDYMYYIKQTYGRFLYYLSPPSWRACNRNFAQSMEIELKGFDLGAGGVKTFTDIFDKMQKECFSDLVSPALYFTSPNQLIQLFEFIGNQQLSCLVDIEFLAPLIKQAKDDAKFLEEIIVQESASLLGTIKSMKTLLEESEKKCLLLENKFYKIANGLFYESTGAPEVIKLTLHLEFVYEVLFSEKPMNVDIVTMAKSLESFHLHYCDRLDSLLHVNIKDAVRQAVDIEHMKIKRAKKARRDLCVFDTLKKKLLRAFEPPAQRKCSNFKEVFKTDKDGEQVMVANLNKQTRSKKPMKNCTAKAPLTATELEYLTIFTNWCPDEDPAKYLHTDIE
ncbi:uncharacterized protein LOC128673002 [Plodia interpunctella]|uniref:uncharacterized protein LOC128673002 n=1 Tax=Plodia interpunctella TaxID=58824 RepID=UPI0023685600|nr:uncharacterized protein LOC128673002 [Plodia interpunctella]